VRIKLMQSRANRRTGFTLLEMLVVLAIVALLVSIVGPRLFGRADAAKVQAATAQIKVLRGAVELMRMEINVYPTEEQGLGLLTTAPTDSALSAKWKGPYLNENIVPVDPWGNAYIYAPPAASGKGFTLKSYGADGKPGGTGHDADLGDLEAPSQP
jgi:general secretion pathway protein G